MKRQFLTGCIYMFLSAVALSVVGLFGKIGISIFSLTSLMFWRFLFAFVLCFPLFWLLGYFKESFPFSNLKMHIFRAILGLSAQYCFYFYLEKTTLLHALVMINTSPIFLALIEVLVLRKHVGKSTWIAVLISFIGVLLVLQPKHGIISLFSLVGLLAGFFQGASQVVFGINSRTERSDISVLYLFFFCALFSLVPYLISGPSWTFEPTSLWISLLLLLALGFASIFNQLWRAIAYQHATPSRLAVFFYLAVPLGGIYDWAVFGRIPNHLSILGAGLVILGGIVKIYLRGQTSPAK